VIWWGGGREEKEKGLFHKVRGQLQLHHHFRPWAHMYEKSSDSYITSAHTGLKGLPTTLRITKCSMLQPSLTTLQNASLTPARIFLQGLTPARIFLQGLKGNGIGTGYICFTPTG